VSGVAAARADWPRADARALIRRALGEDLGAGDRTSEITIPFDLEGVGAIRAKAVGVLAGLEAVAETFAQLDTGVRVELPLRDGESVAPGTVVARAAGRVRDLLAGERVALNLLAHLSGIATLTSKFVREVEGTRAKIHDTRKTTPGLRSLEKYAVRCGGGENHRFGLHDMILVKENHIAAAGGITAAVRAVTAAALPLRFEIEVRTRAEALEAVQAGARLLLLDNMSPEEVRESVDAVRAIAPDVVLEVSGGLSLGTVRAYALAGVDRLSVGALTHSAPALDLSMLLEVSPGDRA